MAGGDEGSKGSKACGQPRADNEQAATIRLIPLTVHSARRCGIVRHLDASMTELRPGAPAQVPTRRRLRERTAGALPTAARCGGRQQPDWYHRRIVVNCELSRNMVYKCAVRRNVEWRRDVGAT